MAVTHVIAFCVDDVFLKVLIIPTIIFNFCIAIKK